MKTYNAILSDFWVLVSANAGIAALSGGIYKKTRPTDSVLEDCVLHIVPGTSGKFLQSGALYVKLFYKDLFINNTWYEDMVNGATKEALLFTLSESLLKMPGYSFFVESREIYTESSDFFNQAVSDGSVNKQHYAILKMNFKL